jgi:hypothetical protein
MADRTASGMADHVTEMLAIARSGGRPGIESGTALLTATGWRYFLLDAVPLLQRRVPNVELRPLSLAPARAKGLP